MTGMVKVDTEALTRLAERIRQAAAEARAATAHAGPLQAGIGALVAPGLVRAAGTFIDSWGTALADVVAEADRLADAIVLVARGYSDAESVIARGMLP